jgi:hypothetical protein
VPLRLPRCCAGDGRFTLRKCGAMRRSVPAERQHAGAGKNRAVLLAAVRQLARRGMALPLVVAGQRGWLEEVVVKANPCAFSAACRMRTWQRSAALPRCSCSVVAGGLRPAAAGGARLRDGGRLESPGDARCAGRHCLYADPAARTVGRRSAAVSDTALWRRWYGGGGAGGVVLMGAQAARETIGVPGSLTNPRPRLRRDLRLPRRERGYLVGHPALLFATSS